jgi:hypothetical protein
LNLGHPAPVLSQAAGYQNPPTRNKARYLKQKAPDFSGAHCSYKGVYTSGFLAGTFRGYLLETNQVEEKSVQRYF